MSGSKFDPRVAIIGMSCRLPGANTIAQFWKNVCDGVESAEHLDEKTLIERGVPARKLSSKDYVKVAFPIANVELFDAEFFAYTPREASIIDPQQRIFLECAWEALESAGYANGYDGRIGVYAGTGMNFYAALNLLSRPEILDAVGGAGAIFASDKDFVAMRAAYKINLTGPAINIQTACSTSLVATHLACQGLLTGECDMALAGATSIRQPHNVGYSYVEGGILSPDGRCRPFDRAAQGTVSASGSGVVVLKRLQDAIEDRDNIVAVICGSAVNNDGAAKAGFTAPSADGQADVINAAISMSGIGPEAISLVEAHGTGTSIGDPIEFSALTRCFQKKKAQRGTCAIGSVKGNIGHTDTAAGVAGLIKTALALKHRKLPPSINFSEPNPAMDFASSPFFVNTKLQEWKVPPGRARYAGVSSFGIGGTNAHMILSDPPDQRPSGKGRKIELLVVSTKSKPALNTAAANMIELLGRADTPPLSDICYTAAVGRRAWPHRRFAVIRNDTDVAGRLDDFALATEAPALDRPTVFMFPGQGAQYVNMAAGLFRSEPIFRDIVSKCAGILQAHINLDLEALLYPSDAGLDAASDQLSQTKLAQPAIFVISYAMAHLWMSWGVKPVAMLGHSFGEYVAACLAGVFRLEDALRLVAFRAQLIQTLPNGAMTAVGASAEWLTPRLQDDTSIAAVNADDRCVLSGSLEAIAKMEAELTAEGIAVRRLGSSHAFHSRMMDPVLETFGRALGSMELRSPTIPYLSNVTGDWVSASLVNDPAYWVRHLRETVMFAKCVGKIVDGLKPMFLEVGPGRLLSSMLNHALPADLRDAVAASIGGPSEPNCDLTCLLHAVGKAWSAGVPVDFKAFYLGQQRNRVELPTYPFQRRRHWVERKSKPASSAGAAEVSRSATNDVDVAKADQRRHGPSDGEAHGPSSMSAVEQVIAGIWAECLGVGSVRRSDDFFQLGGDSLLVTQVINRIRRTFGVDVPARALFEAPTVMQLSSAAVMHEKSAGQVERIASLRTKFAKLSMSELHELVLSKEKMSGSLPVDE